LCGETSLGVEIGEAPLETALHLVRAASHLGGVQVRARLAGLLLELDLLWTLLSLQASRSGLRAARRR
jgi:hypothetical protein